MTCLWDLAQERKQPEFQYMDQGTLEQIKLHRPQFKNDFNYCLTQNDIELLLEMSPKSDWYLTEEIISSIHGIAHTLRVMVYALILAKKHLNDDQLEALLLACAVHDTQRLDDKGDEGHEERALEWLEKGFVKQSQIRLVSQILNGEHDYEKYLRTADALDRYRLPKVKWWIDESFLSLRPEESMKSFAFDLVVGSEQARLNGVEDVEAVFSNLHTT